MKYKSKEVKTRKKRVELKPRGLNKNRRPQQLVNEYKLGRLMTITEWANRFKITYREISVMLTNLRKKGYHFHPYTGSIIINGKKRTGILVLSPEKEEWAINAMNNYEDNYSLPFLKGQFSIFHSVLIQQPQLASQIIEFAENLMLEAIQSNKKLNTEKRLQLKSGNK